MADPAISYPPFLGTTHFFTLGACLCMRRVSLLLHASCFLR
jgi:hypothetical protein